MQRVCTYPTKRKEIRTESINDHKMFKIYSILIDFSTVLLNIAIKAKRWKTAARILKFRKGFIATHARKFSQ